jgi:hypothetical protein
MALWGVVASVAILWVFGLLLERYEIRRRDRLQALRDAKSAERAGD